MHKIITFAFFMLFAFGCAEDEIPEEFSSAKTKLQENILDYVAPWLMQSELDGLELMYPNYGLHNDKIGTLRLISNYIITVIGLHYTPEPYEYPDITVSNGQASPANISIYWASLMRALGYDGEMRVCFGDKVGLGDHIWVELGFHVLDGYDLYLVGDSNYTISTSVDVP
jgi:hypothetical protein